MYSDHTNMFQGVYSTILMHVVMCNFPSRIDCFSDNSVNSSNIQPQISRGSSFSGSPNASIDEYVVFDWPLHVYLNSSRALPSQIYGQYICRSNIGYYVRNYVHDSKFIAIATCVYF